MYFATRPLTWKSLGLRAGDPFPFQDKPTIRGFGPAYGVPHADRMPFADLSYVQALNVRTEANRRYITQHNLSYDQAVAFLRDGIIVKPEAA